MRIHCKTLMTIVALGLLISSCHRQPIQIEASVTPLSDYQSNDGSIAISITGGKAPYSIRWEDNQTTAEISNLAAGRYIVAVTDARGYLMLDTIEVDGPTCPVCIDNEGNSYKTTIIGGRTWMTENLRTTINSNGDNIKFYQNADSVELGFLYTWEVAMDGSTIENAQGLCPDGWHIPSDKEWNELATNLTNDTEVENLINPFDLVYAGFYNGDFQNAGNSTSFWSSTKAHNNVWKMYFHKGLKKPFRYHEKPDNAISVRCVKDTENQGVRKMEK